MSEYNILNEKEMNETISVSECRKLREAINALTFTPIITKKEYVRLMVICNQITKRILEDC